MTKALRIVVIAPDMSVYDESDEAARIIMERSQNLRNGLMISGFNLVATLTADTFLTERLTRLQPDLVIVDAESDARDALEHVVIATRDARRPIVMFTNDDDKTQLQAALAAGVSAYIVAGLSIERIRPILDVAIARFHHEENLRQELACARNEVIELNAELQDRKLVDRAKAYLMERHKISETDAYARLRKTAMEKNMRLAEVAQRLLDVAQLLS